MQSAVLEFVLNKDRWRKSLNSASKLIDRVKKSEDWKLSCSMLVGIWWKSKQIWHKAFNFCNCRCFLDYLRRFLRAGRRNKCEETLPPRQRCLQKLLNLDLSDSGMILVCYKSFSKEVMYFPSMLFLVCWPSNASGEGKRRRNVQCSLHWQIWFWFISMCCKRLQSQQTSSTMTLIFGNFYQILPSVPSETSHGSPWLSYRNRSRRPCRGSKGQGVRWKIFCPNCNVETKAQRNYHWDSIPWDRQEAERRAFGGIRKNISHAEVLCLSWVMTTWECWYCSTLRSCWEQIYHGNWNPSAVTAWVLMVARSGLLMAELLLLVPLVKVVQAMTDRDSLSSDADGQVELGKKFSSPAKPHNLES